MSYVQVIVNAVDNASKVLKGVRGEITKTGKAGQTASGNLSGMSKVTANLSNELKKAETDIVKQALGFTALSGAAVALVNVIKSSINDWVAYNEEIRKLGAATGTSTEDLSRLMQAADDVGVSMEAMKTAMVYASKNGVKPTVENIALLSDRLLAITDTTERSKEMTRLFGRGYAEVAGFVLQGSKAIRDSTAAIDDNLVVTKESAAQSREYAVQLDNLNDTVTGLKNELAMGLLPSIIDVMDEMNSTIKTIIEISRGIEELTKKTQDNTKGWQRWAAALWNVLTIQYKLGGYLRGELYDGLDWIEGKLSSATEETENYTPTVEALTRAYEQSIPAMQYYAAQADEVKEETEDLGDAAKKAGKQISFLFDELNTDITGDILKSLDQIAYKLNFGDVVNNSYIQAKEAIKNNSIKPAEGIKILEGLFVAAEALRVKGGEIDFKEAAQNIKENLDIPLADAAKWLQYLISKDGSKMNYTALLNILYATSGRKYEPYNPGATGPGGGTGGGSGPRGAKGLDMVVPAGYPNDSYPINVQSGERVIVIPKGNAGNNSNIATTNNWNLTVNNPANTINVLSDFRLMQALAGA